MAITLEAIDLNREYGTVLLDRLPSDNDFHALDVALRGIDALLAGQQPDAEFIEHFMFHPAIEASRLRWMPTTGKTQ